MTIGPPHADFPTIVSTLAEALGRDDGLASYRDLDALYRASWQALPHLSGPFMLAACLFPFVSFVLRGPVGLRLARVAIVSSDGHEASRWRIFWRSLVAWSPMWVLAAYLTASRPGFRSLDTLEGAWLAHPIATLAAFGTQFVFNVLALTQPNRRLHDYLAGTWLVPR